MGTKVVLFDLDGTLLPMDQNAFVKVYFGLLAQKLAPLGYEAKQLISSIWRGTEAMIRNEGEKINEDAFWDKFAEIYGEHVRADEPYFNEFYEQDFYKVQASCGFNEKAAAAVETVKAKGLRVALATNPIFPAIATKQRIEWAGLKPTDFELYTTYENSRYCKPNLAYYQEIIKRLGVSAEECLMIGNDVGEDMVAEKLGMKVFLLTDCIINKEEKDVSVYPNGGYAELLQYIENL